MSTMEKGREGQGQPGQDRDTGRQGQQQEPGRNPQPGQGGQGERKQ